jgi:release factor glutamine methyltransferase
LPLDVPLTAHALIREGTRRLAARGFESARVEAEWLLSHLLGTTTVELYLAPQAPVEAGVAGQFMAAIARRAAGTPLQYVLGQAEFFGAAYEVRPGVFIPRPETEAVVEQALGAFRRLVEEQRNVLRLLDLGTGSGCIAVTLARALSSCLVVGVELSWEALVTARRNIRRYGVDRAVQLVQGHWTEPVSGPFDGIIANPPYVPSGDVDRLPLDVRQEPRMSLDGGPNGMQPYGYLLADAPRVLRRGGIFVLECGETQAEPLARMATGMGWTNAVEPIRDLTGRLRGLLLTRR